MGLADQAQRVVLQRREAVAAEQRVELAQPIIGPPAAPVGSLLGEG
jgi:hypothetical protein